MALSTAFAKSGWFFDAWASDEPWERVRITAPMALAVWYASAAGDPYGYDRDALNNNHGLPPGTFNDRLPPGTFG